MCAAKANCWAAGRFGTQRGGTVLKNEALHWNGKKWSLTRTPDPGGSTTGAFNALNSIRCGSAASCIAVGSYGTLASPFNLLNEVLRWNGHRWARVSVPSPGGTAHDGDFSQLESLTCTAPANCWAAGLLGTFAAPETFLNQILHWNGSDWSEVFAPQPAGDVSGALQRIASITCSSASRCWAVGNYVSTSGGGVTLNQALRWTGGPWFAVRTPEPGGSAHGDTNQLSGVRCTSSASCWAVGAATTSGGSDFNEVLHWNGTRWSAR